MNMRLSQRGKNPLEAKLLTKYLDAINFDLQDSELAILN